MEKFGIWNIVMDWSDGNALRWEDVLKMDNGTVLLAMQMKSTLSRIEYNMKRNIKD